ncbi:hypothetical protein M3Y98_00979400 [Aphelenchoides besseyi]|nr:hypothetical protein M3Y98_00979400 [Aphelenchoides besseyi]
MLVVHLLLPIGLVVSFGNAQYGQRVSNDGYSGIGQASVGEGYESMGQSARVYGQGQSSQGVANVANSRRNDDFGQRTAYVAPQSLPNNGQGLQPQYGQQNPIAHVDNNGASRQTYGQGFNNYGNQNSGYGVATAGQQGNYGQSLPTLEGSQRNYRSPNLGQQAPHSSGLGQGINNQGNGMGQNIQTSTALGQGTQPSSGLGQHLNAPFPQSNGLSQGLNTGIGSLRLKRYSNRDPYKKTCNSYYGKFICYRLYESDSEIPVDFTCWVTHMNKKNCTETENVLYLDRRNVEVDPSELDRVFQHQNGRRSQDSPDLHRDRPRDDEFGAIEKNLHGRRNEERRLPADLDDRRESRNGRVYEDREFRRNQRS